MTTNGGGVMALRSHHDWESSSYVAEWVADREVEDPSRVENFRFMSRLLPFGPEDAATILDLGGGYGLLTRVMADEFPVAKVVLHDYSAPMHDVARQRLAEFGGRIKFVRSDLMSPDWTTDLPGPFDAVVSSMCLHNLGSSQRVRQIYREVFDLLGSGGCFFDIDLINGPSPPTQWAYSSWMQHRHGGSDDPDDPAGTRALVASKWDLAQTFPFPASLAEKLTWLRQAGFQSVDCWWKEMGVALVGGFRLDGEGAD